MSKSNQKKVRKIDEISSNETDSKIENIPRVDEIMTMINESISETEKVLLSMEPFKDGDDPLFDKLDYKEIFSSLSKRKSAKIDDQITATKHPKQATNVLNAFLGYPQKMSFNTSKRFESELIRKMPLFHEYGDCLIGASRPKQGELFKCPLTDPSSQSYIHHLGISANSLLKNAFYTGDMLSKVSSSKKGDDPLTLSHLCGNGGCGRVGHIIIESKKVNEKRIACHHFLKQCKNLHQAKIIRNLCTHHPKCFTNDYIGLGYYYYKVE
jgi:hypothetical protein